MPRETVPPHVRQRRLQRQARLARLGFEDYPAYLRSSNWSAVRRRYRESDLPQVCMCGEEDVQLHHMTYERVGEEELTDLVPLCANCHVMIHVLERRGEIALDFAGFESLARAMEYRKTRADSEALSPAEWHQVRLDAYVEKRRERSRARRKRGRREKVDPKVTDPWRARPVNPKLPPPLDPHRLQELGDLYEAQLAERAAKQDNSEAA